MHRTKGTERERMESGAPKGLYILRSSAGAGKTHALVKHYLKACLCSPAPDAYRHVLALTFTNKAAGEMKNRVLEYLSGLAAGCAPTGRMANVQAEVMAAAGIKPEALAQRAHAMHRHMLHNWPQVAISTIDAFTRRITKPFARDLQLDQDLEMTTEQDWYMQLAIDKLLAKAGHDEELTKVLAEACVQLLEDERRWDARSPLFALSKELGKESSVAPLAALQDRSPEATVRLTRELRKKTAAHRAHVRSLGTAALRLFNDAGIEPEDLWKKTTGPIAWFKRLALYEGDLMKMAPTFRAALEEGTLASKQASTSAKSAIASFTPRLAEILNEAERLQPGYVLMNAVLGQLMPTAALQALDEELTVVKAEDGVAFFSDLTRKVAELVRDEPAAFIHERIGERYRHYLIDEFQDTSRMQWHGLVPLVHNALSNNGSALMVGDAKQAIYRWRGGDARQFVALPALHDKEAIADGDEREAFFIESNTKPEPLPYNYRSARSIVEFNNDLFERLGKLLPVAYRHVYAGQQQEVKSAAEGLVVVRAFDKPEEGDEKIDAHRQFVIGSLNEALADGCDPGDIAVLVHTHSKGKLVTEWLTAEGHSVTSPDGLKLDGDTAAEFLMDLFRMLHNNDRAAGIRAVQFLALLHDAPVDDGSISVAFRSKSESLEPLHRTIAGIKADLLRQPLNTQLHLLAEQFGVHAASDAHVLFLLDEAHSSSTAHGNDPILFIEHWERVGKNRSVQVPASPQAVKLLTVHKAKGLEFPVVIVPFPERKTDGRNPDHLWIAPGEVIPDMPYALVRESKNVLELPLPEVIEEMEQRQLDNLNTLYVALTRPEDRLYVLVSRNTKDEFLKGLLDLVDERGMVGNEWRAGERAAATHRTEATAGALLTFPPLAGKELSLAMRFDAPEQWDPADPDPYRSKGKAIHAVIASLRTADELEGALSTAIQRGELESAEADELRAQLDTMLRREDLSPWFGNKSVVRSETTLITADGHAARPDRLAMEPDRVRVLDIKTGLPSEHHHKQVQGYMHVLNDAGHPEVSGHLLYIATGELVEVK